MARYSSLIFFLFAWIAQTGGGAEQRRPVLNGSVHPFATNAYFSKIGGYIPTNTVRFEHWALLDCVRQVNEMAAKWHLEITLPLTTNAVDRFSAYPKTNGYLAGLTISNRFTFDWDNGKFERFHDLKYCTRALIPNQSVSDEEYQKACQEKLRLGAQWFRSGKKLTREAAIAIAHEALHARGFDEKELKLGGPLTRQEYWKVGERERALPLWHVEWYSNGRKTDAFTRFEVSGLTGTIVQYFNLLEKRLPMPENYYELLGLKNPK